MRESKIGLNVFVAKIHAWRDPAAAVGEADVLRQPEVRSLALSMVRVFGRSWNLAPGRCD